MNLLDRRFLNISLAVKGIANEPAANPTVGTQYIVGDEPSGAFANFTQNYIARYNGSAWEAFSPKTGGLEVLNLSNNQFLLYNGSTWVSTASLTTEDENIPIIVVKAVGISPATSPDGYFGVYLSMSAQHVEKALYDGASSGLFELTENDKFLSLTDNKIYTCTAVDNHDYAVTGTFSASLPKNGQIIFNSDEQEMAFYRYDGYDNKIVLLGSIKNLKPVDKIIDAFTFQFFEDDDAVTTYQNSHATEGYTFTLFDRVYSYSASGGWTMSTLSEGDRFLALNFQDTLQPRIYEYIDSYGDSFASAFSYDSLFNGNIFLNKADGALYFYNGSTVVKLSGSSSGSSGTSLQYLTEVHTLTAQEISNNAFSLLNFIASGQESNILCFVDGVAQAAGTDFSASGNSITWNNKGLADVGLVAGDVFILHYVKA